MLIAWQWPRVKQGGGILPILKGGLRTDAHQIAIFAVIPALLAPWLGHSPLAVDVTSYWFQIALFLFVLLELSTPQFIIEYDTRPNRLYVEYLSHPREVFGMLWKGYKALLIGAAVAIAGFIWLDHTILESILPDAKLPWWWALLLSVSAMAISILVIRGTLGHRPMNPSTVAYCGDSMLNTLPLNSFYSVSYAIYSMKNERSAGDVYGHMDAAEMTNIICHGAGFEAGPKELPTLHRQTPAKTRATPLNIVLIVQESLGAQYVGNLGGQNLTPHLDALAQTGWNFTRAYATGTRSVRGLEAVAAGFPPTIADAALRLPGAQSNFFTLAQLLGKHDYRSRFIYGGEAHFDNMKSFFLGNGFNELHDRSTFTNAAFVGTWGASDEDMFNRLHALLSDPPEQPTLTLAFTVSNHSPWEYPQGRIQPQGDPASVENTVRYADWAMGQFFEQARASSYWQDTVFLVVADHDSRVGGASLVPLRHFHIPAVIVGANIAPRHDERLISQIDLAPTLLSIAGLETEHPMIGHDLTRGGGGRAMMQYSENYGYLKADQLIVLEPHKTAQQFQYLVPDHYEARPLDPALAQEALAHVLWPSWSYQHGAYSLPHLLRKPTAA